MDFWIDCWIAQHFRIEDNSNDCKIIEMPQAQFVANMQIVLICTFKCISRKYTGLVTILIRFSPCIDESTRTTVGIKWKIKLLCATNRVLIANFCSCKLYVMDLETFSVFKISLLLLTQSLLANSDLNRIINNAEWAFPVMQ